MKKIIVCIAFAMLLVFSAAAVSDDGMPCKQIKARATFDDFEFQSPCEKYAGFDWCWVGVPLKGSIKGVWDGHGQWDWVIFDVRDFGLPTWEAGAYYQMNFDIFIGKHGEIHSETLWAADNRVPGATMSVITGGTGIYEDASGLIASWSFDGSLWKVKGEVCGPYIPIDDDDDSDSDSD